MPLRKYEWETEDEKKEVRKRVDREKKFAKYWKDNYNLNVKEDQLEMLKKYKSEIKKILPIMDFVRSLELIENI
jgi:hypothetical protein|tara:strand:+ start:53 stop:274 length:222 start_codon:yes stop_codon:yes gene_type:complete